MDHYEQIESLATERRYRRGALVCTHARLTARTYAVRLQLRGVEPKDLPYRLSHLPKADIVAVSCGFRPGSSTVTAVLSVGGDAAFETTEPIGLDIDELSELSQFEHPRSFITCKSRLSPLLDGFS